MYSKQLNSCLEVECTGGSPTDRMACDRLECVGFRTDEEVCGTVGLAAPLLQQPHRTFVSHFVEGQPEAYR